MLIKIQLVKIVLVFSVFIFGIISCVDPFEIDYDLNSRIIIVDGVLSDEQSDQYIRLKESKIISTNKISAILPLQNCIIEILVNGVEKVGFTENPNDPGSYIGPKGFVAEPNKTYQLIFKTNNGVTYTSKTEKLEKGAEISKVYQQLKIIGKSGDKNYRGYHEIFLDLKDLSGIKNYYLWDFNLYEAQEVCRTCEAGERYYTRPLPGVCIKDLPPAFRNVVYDYECYGSCWEILHSTKINIMTDEFSDGKTITARSITEVPIYHLNSGALIEIKQQSINASIYRYYKILSDQNQNSGGLADTPPVSLIGNIESSDKSTVAGYFRVTDETKYYHWVDRSDVLKTDIKPVFLIGRPTNFEPSAEDITRPPLVTCVNSYSRTNIRPKGWLINNRTQLDK